MTLEDIVSSVSTPALIKDNFIKHGTFHYLPNGDLEMYAGGFTLVFPVDVNGQCWGFRCWHANLGNLRRHFEVLSEELKKLQLPYFCDFTYVEEGIVVDGMIFPTTRMRWIDGVNLKEYLCENQGNKQKMLQLAERFVEMITALHSAKISHGDLQHGNILVNSNGELFLIDYDSVYTPLLQGQPDIIKGLKGYQHPNRQVNIHSNEKLDYFSELIIYTSILAIAENPQLAQKYNVQDSEQLLFTESDFADLYKSEIYADLQVLGGIFPLLLKILAEYLAEDDITQLSPFSELLDQYTKAPTINNFHSTTPKTVVGNECVLTWESNDCSALFINNEKILSSDRYYTFKGKSIGLNTFTLVAENGLKKFSSTISVEVVPDVEIQLWLSKNKLRRGKAEQSQLQWNIQNAVSAELKVADVQQSVMLEGSKLLTSDSSVSIELSAIALDGVTRRSKIVELGVYP